MKTKRNESEIGWMRPVTKGWMRRPHTLVRPALILLYLRVHFHNLWILVSYSWILVKTGYEPIRFYARLHAILWQTQHAPQKISCFVSVLVKWRQTTVEFFLISAYLQCVSRISYADKSRWKSTLERLELNTFSCCMFYECFENLLMQIILSYVVKIMKILRK